MIHLYRYFCGCWNMKKKTVHHFPQIQMTNESDIELYDVTVTPNENMSPILYKDTIPFIPPIHGGVVVKVYDGDTIIIPIAIKTLATTISIIKNGMKIAKPI